VGKCRLLTTLKVAASVPNVAPPVDDTREPCDAADHKRVLAGREELQQAQAGRGAVRSAPMEDVVLWDDAARRQLTPGGGHRLRRSAQPDLLLRAGDRAPPGTPLTLLET